ncbi:MAG: rRNA maturation RNase YbeY [Candidatus Vogelbacteria bacterium]|nr:rRNA maturation RNase YbeY [Candidatus Vogelbacteria bacterium]
MLSVNNKTRQKAPSVPFSDLADSVLGPKYDLSLVFCGNTLSRHLNITYRQKDKVANILSFPYEKNSGEIFINLKRAETEAKKFSHSPRQHLIFLFIHGLLHLKGMDHSVKMEAEEQSIFALFSKR